MIFLKHPRNLNTILNINITHITRSKTVYQVLTIFFIHIYISVLKAQTGTIVSCHAVIDICTTFQAFSDCYYKMNVIRLYICDYQYYIACINFTSILFVFSA